MRSSSVLFAVASVVLLGLCSCTHWVRSLPSSTEFDESSKDAIIVLKVDPAARVSMVPGTVDRSGWRMSVGVSSYGAWAENGTIVIKVRPRTGNETYGITIVTPDDGRYARYQARKGVPIPSFHAYPGQVTFVGTLRVEDSEYGGMNVFNNEAPDDRELVAQLMRRKYPRIRAKLVSEVFDMVTRADQPTTSGRLLAAPFRDD
jgi:hypothetical protein